jgi:zinc protease
MKRLAGLAILGSLLLCSCSHRVGEPSLGQAAPPVAGLVSKSVDLPNGLKVVAVERHKLSLFHAELVIKTGAAYDSDDKAGLANITASLLDKGTQTRSASEIADQIDFTGGSMGVSCGYVTTSVSLHVLAEHDTFAMGLLSDMVMRPTFKSEELEKARSRILSDIVRSKEDPFSVTSDAFREMVYKGNPLHRPVAGYPLTLPGITREDVAGFHKTHFVPNNSVLVIVADLSTEEIIGLAEKYLGSWQRGSSTFPPIPDPEPTMGKSVRLVRMDVSQSYIGLGQTGVRRSDPDYNAVRVMNYILGGGGFVSRITRSVRVKGGLAYSAYSYFTPGTTYKGYFRAGAQTKIASTSEALNLILAEIKRIREQGVEPKELEDAKSFYEGSLPSRQESYDQIAGLFVDREIYGLRDNYWVEELKEIKVLTIEDIQKAAMSHLDPDNFVLAIATNPDSLNLSVDGISKDMVEVTNP